MKTIGITLNDIIRDVGTKFNEIYAVHNITKTGVPVESDEQLAGIQCFDISEMDPDQTEIEDVDVYNLEQYFSTKQEYDDFYEESIFELLSLSNEKYEKCMLELNKIAEIAKDFDLKIKILINETTIKERSSTLHFLSKTMCMIDNITFVNTKDELFENCDYLITTDYNLFNNEKTVKMERGYNKDIPCSTTIKDIKNLPSLFEKLT